MQNPTPKLQTISKVAPHKATSEIENFVSAVAQQAVAMELPPDAMLSGLLLLAHSIYLAGLLDSDYVVSELETLASIMRGPIN